MAHLAQPPVALDEPPPPPSLPRCRSVLAVCAHPDDESFGLGAVLAAFADLGTSISVLCFTHGEASTLGLEAGRDLSAQRQVELEQAAAVLGAELVRLLDYPDGGLAAEPLDLLAQEVDRMVGMAAPDLLLVFDEGGITGHPDHMAATSAALLAAQRSRMPVLAWALDEQVTDSLNSNFPGAAFVGRPSAHVDLTVQVDRARQWRAIECHRSQSFDNPVLRHRLGTQHDTEMLRWLLHPTS